jgi:hypothetical protein
VSPKGGNSWRIRTSFPTATDLKVPSERSASRTAGRRARFAVEGDDQLVARAVDIGLIYPADGGQVSVDEVHGGRGDACGVRRLTLAEYPGGERAPGVDPENFIGEVGQHDRVAFGETMGRSQPNQQRLRAERFVGDTGRGGDDPAGAVRSWPASPSPPCRDTRRGPVAVRPSRSQAAGRLPRSR